MSMEDARLDHLTQRLDNLRDALITRAVRMEKYAEDDKSKGMILQKDNATRARAAAYLTHAAIMEAIAWEFRGLAEAAE